MLINIPRYNNIALITAPKIHTDLLWDLTILFVALGALYFIGVFYFRNKFKKQNKIIDQKKRELSPIISEFLFFEENSSKDEKTNYIKLKIEIRQFLRDTFNRRILSEVLLDLGKDVSGQTQRSLFNLYKELELHKDAYKKLESWRWELVSKGIFELTQMKVEESYGFITKFINDKRGTIRKQAEIATVTLKQEGICHFLDTTRYRISEWQQLKLMEVLRNQENYQPPYFKQWLTSGNKDVVLFALRLIKHYNQNNAELSIIELIKHNNIQVKQEAILCVKEFAFYKATETLKLVFWNSSIDTKIAILGALAIIGNKDDLPFLSQIDYKERSFSVKSKAFATINAISPETVLPTEDIETNIQHNTPEDIEIANPTNENIETDTMNQNNSPKETPISPDDSSPKEVSIEKVKEALQEIRETELNSKITGAHLDNEEHINIDFLPIIESEDTNNIEDIDKKEIVESSKKNINDIPVNFQTVIGKNLRELEVDFEEIKTSKELNIDFLPLVTTRNNTKHSDLDTFYKNVPDIIYDNDFSVDDKEEVELDFLPVVFEEVPNKNNPNSIDEIDSENIKDLEFKYEEVTIKKIITALEAEKIFDINSLIVDYSIISPEITKEENYSIIPKPFFYNDEELELLTVLENIEVLGDAREIPLLQEYLKQEKYGFIKDRILELLEKFTPQNIIKPSNDMRIKEEEKYTKEINLIEELFNNSDSESKLILLDEIVAVGDKKELKILNKLLSDSDNSVRQKALECIAQLQNEINNKEELKLTDSKNIDTVEPIPLEYAFLSDYEKELKKNNIKPAILEKVEPVAVVAQENIKKETTFLDQFYSFSNRLFEKLNG